ncbi:hypothetical protein HJC23_013066 [Cyclotella cryptica]|uniref:DNA 3'-5' helicase n=1 Tax=Cyclotella cryptica TaxID=29204 RepID=A0ABD3Q7P3_9STRA|eukprot:CCRYP_008117-RA/>CCRYP_008117-RA protein AED:0.02 eAED:0.02 QI:294/1/1/1/0.5/0.4/5/2703/1166
MNMASRRVAACAAIVAALALHSHPAFGTFDVLAFGSVGPSTRARPTVFQSGACGVSADTRRCEITATSSPLHTQTKRQRSTRLGYSIDELSDWQLFMQTQMPEGSEPSVTYDSASNNGKGQSGCGNLSDELSKVWSSLSQSSALNEGAVSYEESLHDNESKCGTDDQKSTDHDIDNWSDSVQRRKHRLKSLNSFNEANAILQQKHQIIKPLPPPSPLKLNLPYNDQSQLQAIQSNAPAILLSSGPGTGKSHVLSLRIAYLLRMQLNYEKGHAGDTKTADVSSTPDSMVILSFTNRDAERLKECALDYLFPSGQTQLAATQEWRNQTSRQLWSGTMHAFSLAILRKYGYSGTTPLRVLPARAMRNRVSLALRSLLNGGGEEGQYTVDEEALKNLRIRHVRALNDVGHSRSILFQNIVRCIDLWKEALLIRSSGGVRCGEDKTTRRNEALTHDELSHQQHEQQLEQQRETHLRNDCVELAMRLGIPESSALLALDVFPLYQARHAAAGTADPSDLAGMAYRLLLANTEALHLLRAKLKHIIVDEYQDMSVSQHSLLRLVIRGESEDDDASSSAAGENVQDNRTNQQHRSRKSPILLDPYSTIRKSKKRSRLRASLSQSFNVPNLFAAGDAQQSIYGWRAAAPSLTVDGFRKDFPQGVVAQLNTCYRLPSDILDASNMLLPIDLKEDASVTKSYDVSPAAATKLASSISTSSQSHPPTFPAESDLRLGESLLLSKGLQKLDSTVLIHGLWDSREEYKYIASTIRRRSKERRKSLIIAMNQLDVQVDTGSDKEQFDMTDVAVMVRSSDQMDLLKEALNSYGIPYVVAVKDSTASSQEGELPNHLTLGRASRPKTIPMKPATLMTMHRAKGEEFDDVYLAGWSEGCFPHPEAVSSNLIHEERRLAYVALTRARQRVVITHCLMSRTLYYGKDGSRRYVTGQVQPSRFLYELVPSKKKIDGILDSKDDTRDISYPSSLLEGNGRTVWDRKTGIKDYVVGQNVPDFFQKSYVQPKGFVDRRADLRQHTNLDMNGLLETPERDRRNQTIPRKTNNSEFMIGEKVVVANMKHPQYGKVGVVEKVSKCFVFFREHESKQTIKIKPASLRIAQTRETNSLISIPMVVDKRCDQLKKIGEDEGHLKTLTVQQLKVRLRKRKLRVSGRKSDLINRLLWR